MRDGIRLATDVFRPTENDAVVEERRPVILMRTPYNKTARERRSGYCQFFAEHGYVSVSQDCRGCYRSEGDVDFLLPEAEDGFDTLMWIKQQPWAGMVGSWGTSWSGWTQTAMAALGPDNLAVMIPNFSGADAYTSSVRHNGVLELRFIAWAFWHSRFNNQAALKKDPAIDKILGTSPPFRDWLGRWPIKRGQTQLKAVPVYEKWAFDLIEKEDPDDFWRNPSMNPAAYHDNFPDIPVLYVGGWYDSYTRASFENFVSHSKQKKAISLLVGPWTHGADTPEKSFAGDVEFGQEAALESFRSLHLATFDRFLKGVRSEPSPPLRIFVMGGGCGEKSAQGRLIHGGCWRNEQEWPLARTVFKPLYLHPPESAASLSFDAVTTDANCSEYRYDPDHPVPSIGGNVSSLGQPKENRHARDPDSPAYHEMDQIMTAGGFDQVEREGVFGCSAPFKPLGDRDDVLVFETDPLTEDLEVTGPLTASLWVSTSAFDTDFAVKLIDVYPPNGSYADGYRLNISDSIQRLSFADGSGRKSPVAPGTIVEINIAMYPTSNVFAAGHRIRLDISSSNFPRFDTNSNTADRYLRAIAVNRIYHDKEHRSHLSLPTIPSVASPSAASP